MGKGTHCFDVEDAERFGISEAILLYNFKHWIKHNQANHINYFEGRYWTFNSSRALAKIHPYFSMDQIDRIVAKLIKGGVLLVGSFNRTKYDRTRWFSINEQWTCEDAQSKDEFVRQHGELEVQGSNIAFRESAESMSSNRGITAADSRNHSRDIAGPIPDIVCTDINLEKPIDFNQDLKENNIDIATENIRRDAVPTPTKGKIFDLQAKEASNRFCEKLNSLTNSRHKATTKTTIRDIMRILGEGYTVDDILSVVDRKFEEWAGCPTMGRFLTPITLLGPKFPTYIAANFKANKAPSWRPGDLPF